MTILDKLMDRYEAAIDEKLRLYTAISENRKLLTRIDEEILTKINVFPTNRPCTIDAIAEETKIPSNHVERLLISHRYFVDINDTSKFFGMVYPRWNEMFHLSYYDWVTARHIHDVGFHGIKLRHQAGNLTHRIRSTKQSNWRFVASKNVVYLERTE